MLKPLLLVPLLPLAGFLLLVLGGRRWPRALVAVIGVGSAGLAALVASVVAGALFYMPAGMPREFTQTLWTWMNVGGFSPQMTLHLDALSCVMMLVVAWVGFLILLYSAEFMADDDGYARFFCPDETTSNRMEAVFEATARAWLWPMVETDEFLSRGGRVMEILSEHTCQGWLEGYLLTGRHGLFACYEAFIPIVDSMLNQYAKWLKVARETPWRKPLASLNYLLTSHVWRQDHNGYTHQVPSFINEVVNKKSSVARVYLPPDANCLLSVADHCLRSTDYVNLIVASKQANPQWLDLKAAREHCARGASVWQWASNDAGAPDVILAAAGDVPTTETLAAAWMLRRQLPDLRVRVVNVVDLFTLISHHDHPHGLDEGAFAEIFTESADVIFAFHGYPKLIHELVHHRPNPARFHVHGYIEEGRTTTPFDMLVLNDMSRFQLAVAALQRVGRLRSQAGSVIDYFEERLAAHRSWIRDHDVDLPEVLEWKWGDG